VSDLAIRPAPTVVGPGPAARPAAPVGDLLVMMRRAVRLTIRNGDALITSLALPIMLMLLFVYLFGGAIETGTEYVTYVVPGVIMLCASFGASLTAPIVTNDMTNGIMDRFRSMDIRGAAVLGGHVFASTTRNMVSTALVLGVGFLIGFRPSASFVDWLAVVGLLVVAVLALSWASAAVGLLAKTPEAANGFTFFVMFLPYPSSAFVPVETMPSWIHGFADNQPFTPLIESLRGFLLGTPVGNSPWIALAWCGGILAASVAATGVLFKRRTA
jgi:ABC-2 type transport system permease protein